MYLAIDTSTPLVGVALADKHDVTSEDTWRCIQNHSVELLPHIAAMMKKAGVDVKDLDGIIVAKGPGGFNGLRVGMGTAKGLAYSLSVPIVGISTLSAAAFQYAAPGLPVCAVLPAGRSEIAWAIYREVQGEWENTVPETISSPEDLYVYVNSPTFFAGELDETLLEEIRSRLGEFLKSPSGPVKTRVHALAQLGMEQIAKGHLDDVATLQPLYLRRPPITEPKSNTADLRQPSPAVILDMDGVIVDSGELHFKSWQEAFARYGEQFSRQDFSYAFGLVNRDIITHKLKDRATGELIEAIDREKEKIFRKLVETEGIKPLPGAATLIESLHRQEFRLAVASSAPRANVKLILNKLALQHCFQAVVSVEDVTRGKPDPQPFLIAAERLGALPGQCTVIEDAPAGVEAARSGGMKAIGVTSSHRRAELAEADLVVDSLTELDADKILKLIKEK